MILATGAQRHRDLDLPGRSLAGIDLAMPYLTAGNRRSAGLPGAVAPVGGARVIVIGAGDTSADCLGTAHREGAAHVTEIAHGPRPPERRSPQRTWPEWPRLERTYAAHLEGGARSYALEPVAFEGSDGHVTHLRGRQVAFGDYDGIGHRPAPTPGDEVLLAVDRVLVAIGFAGVECHDPVYRDVELTGRGTVAVDGLATSLAGVFAAGDCVRGADLVVTAIADGRAAAAAVERALLQCP